MWHLFWLKWNSLQIIEDEDPHFKNSSAFEDTLEKLSSSPSPRMDVWRSFNETFQVLLVSDLSFKQTLI